LAQKVTRTAPRTISTPASKTVSPSAARSISKPVTCDFVHHPPVDPAAAEQFLAASHLGQRIKRLRLKRSMGLMELGKLTGLSASFLSQLETGRVVPTLRNLARLSLVFNKDLSHFFDSEDKSIFRVQRKKDRVRLTMGSSQPDYIAESFSILIPEGGLRPCLAEFLSGEPREPFHPDQYPGVEMVYVLNGYMEVDRNGEKHTLNERDVLYISGETTRSYRSTGKTAARALIVSFDDENGNARRSKKH
jgi:transcriptional regulator with XRE-family HTH domain